MIPSLSLPPKPPTKSPVLSSMLSQGFQAYFLSVVTFTAFQSAFGLRLAVPLGKPTFLDQSVNLTWVLGPGDPSTFNVNALCNNMTVPLRNSVRGGDKHVSIPMSLLPTAARFPYASCVLRATDTGNKTTLASSPSFIVLSADLPTKEPSPPLSGPTLTTGTIPSTSLSSSISLTSNVLSTPTSATFPSQANQSSDASVSATILEQFTTEQDTSGLETAVQKITDSLGNVWTLTPETSASLGGIQTPGISGYTQVERTTTITFVTQSSTSTLTLTYTTDIPIQSATFSPSSSSPGAPVLNHTQIVSIVGGLVGSLTVLALLGFICLRRRKRRQVASSNLQPLIYDPNYRQPPEKSGMRLARSCFVSIESQGVKNQARVAEQAQLQTQYDISSSTQLNLELGIHAPTESLEALTQEAITARRLRLQVQRMSERILELEDQQRDGVYGPSSYDVGPPDYADNDSYTYSERVTHG
ncbi:hypothetical protein H0H87_002725 [Tephrocybe sp. NHM501043]|nr:hypothetical protein H0H87_002725 [Tephrocybe sp. NHM501043]